MGEFLMSLLKAVIIAVVPLCATYLVSFLKKKSEQAVAQTENIKTRELMEQVTDAVCTAVTYTSQTYVDALKQSNGFDKAAQAAALNLSLEKAEALLSTVALAALSRIYGDTEAYLTSRIEAEVRRQKLAPI